MIAIAWPSQRILSRTCSVLFLSELLVDCAKSDAATIRLADIGFDITCVEPGTRLLDLARKRLERYSNVSFVESPFESAELSLSEFDVVFAAQSLHWVPEQFRFARSAEILKPSGYIY